MGNRAIVVLVSALGLSVCGQAAAQDESSDREARASYVAGAAAYEEGRYEDALRAFRHAYELSPRPALLFNIGQSLDRLRRDDEALTSLEAYLAAEPEAANRAEVQRRIEVLRQVIEAREARDRRLQERSPVVEPTEEPKRSKWWIAALVGGVLVVGAVVTVLVVTQSDSLEAPIPGDGGRVVTALVSW